MDLGISGRRAIVCGASAGLGRATATALAREGVSVVIAARTRENIEAAAKEIASETGGGPRRRLRILLGHMSTRRRWRDTACRQVIFAPGRAKTGSRRSTPTCSRRSF